MASEVSNGDVLAIVYGMIFWVTSIVLIILCTGFSWLFSRAVKRLPRNSSWIDRSINMYGWGLFVTVRNLAIVNLGLYLIANSGPDLFIKLIHGNLPSKFNELILLLCLLLALPAVMTVWKALSKAAGDVIESFTNGGAATP